MNHEINRQWPEWLERERVDGSVELWKSKINH